MSLTVLCLAFALSAGVVFGQGRTLWQDGGVQLCGTSADSPVAATSDSAGGAIVVWTDTRQWPDRIYAQRVNADGDPQWTENGVLLIDSAWSVYCLDAISDGGHGAIVVHSAPSRLRVQRVNADGVLLWGPKGLILREHDTLPETEYWSAVVPDGRGGATVVWSTCILAHVPDTLLACRVDSSGSLAWEACVRIDTLAEASPCVCPDGEGGVIVAWGKPAGVPPVRVQRLDSTGVLKWGSDGVVVCTSSTVQAVRACMTVGESRFVVGWFGGAGTWQHRAQVFDLSGNRLWGPVGVSVSGGLSSGSSSVGLPGTSTGQTVWIWTENRTGTDDIFAQRLDFTGARCWDSAGGRVPRIRSTGTRSRQRLTGRVVRLPPGRYTEGSTRPVEVRTHRRLRPVSG